MRPASKTARETGMLERKREHTCMPRQPPLRKFLAWPGWAGPDQPKNLRSGDHLRQNSRKMSPDWNEPSTPTTPKVFRSRSDRS